MKFQIFAEKMVETVNATDALDAGEAFYMLCPTQIFYKHKTRKTFVAFPLPDYVHCGHAFVGPIQNKLYILATQRSHQGIAHGRILITFDVVELEYRLISTAPQNSRLLGSCDGNVYVCTMQDVFMLRDGYLRHETAIRWPNIRCAAHALDETVENSPIGPLSNDDMLLRHPDGFMIFLEEHGLLVLMDWQSHVVGIVRVPKCDVYEWSHFVAHPHSIVGITGDGVHVRFNSAGELEEDHIVNEAYTHKLRGLSLPTTNFDAQDITLNGPYFVPVHNSESVISTLTSTFYAFSEPADTQMSPSFLPAIKIARHTADFNPFIPSPPPKRQKIEEVVEGTDHGKGDSSSD